ncbi:hypothetical protein OCU84_25350, partial [Escherichia coli]|uniref:hypothetical protein n=1 Tax=Escherichia coli TaxID=562 RepID=UPI00248238D5
ALGVIEQHSGRRAPQLRVKGHVFCSKKEASPKRGFERKIKLKGFFLVLSSVAGVCGVVVLVERFEVFF